MNFRLLVEQHETGRLVERALERIPADGHHALQYYVTPPYQCQFAGPRSYAAVPGTCQEVGEIVDPENPSSSNPWNTEVDVSVEGGPEVLGESHYVTGTNKLTAFSRLQYESTYQVDQAIWWLDRIERLAPETPWFLWLSFHAAHAPFVLPPRPLVGRALVAEIEESIGVDPSATIPEPDGSDYILDGISFRRLDDDTSSRLVYSEKRVPDTGSVKNVVRHDSGHKLHSRVDVVDAGDGACTRRGLSDQLYDLTADATEQVLLGESCVDEVCTTDPDLLTELQRQYLSDLEDDRDSLLASFEPPDCPLDE